MNRQEIVSRRIVSRISSDGELRVSIQEHPVSPPGEGEITVRIEAAPIHSSDMGLLFGPMDVTKAQQSETAEGPQITAQLPPAAVAALRLRIDADMGTGSEGAGTVVRAGAGAEHLLNKRVAVWGTSTYCDYQNVSIANCIVLPEGVSAAGGAAAFINPLTVLGMIETMRRNGHRALVHTAAASSIGRMLLRLCQDEGIPLVNVVRSSQLSAELRDLGATHVIDSSRDDFMVELTRAISDTGATLGFDAVGGKLAGQILQAMELSARSRMTSFSRYGSTEMKQCYIYGGLDPSPVEIPRSVGVTWKCGGWLLHNFMATLADGEVQKLYERIGAGLSSTFALSFSRHVSLNEALNLDVVRDYMSRRTGSKVLIRP